MRSLIALEIIKSRAFAIFFILTLAIVITSMTALSVSLVTIYCESCLVSLLAIEIHMLSLAPRILDYCALVKASTIDIYFEDFMRSFTNKLIILIRITL
jgi:hypothetical protein